ncbi:MAG TPA: hypothetical protein VFW33_15235 [Gemmataceae bacterium]|nr:hypothetical protein [Gemmataceae bacterium]
MDYTPEARMGYEKNPRRKPQPPVPEQPTFYEQVRRQVAEAADVATALEVHLANLPTDAPWPAELADKTLRALVNAAGVLSLNGRNAAQQLPVPNPSTKEGGYLLASEAVRQLLYDCATLAPALSHVQQRDVSGQLVVPDSDRCWMAMTLDLAARLVRGEVARQKEFVGRSATPTPPPDEGPLFPLPSLN